ncbi:MAG: putative rane protein [Ilumatobacteraceae bacterium]|nr:putative rane protein [Ilumatobacteraceae bacterium]
MIVPVIGCDTVVGQLAVSTVQGVAAVEVSSGIDGSGAIVVVGTSSPTGTGAVGWGRVDVALAQPVASNVAAHTRAAVLTARLCQVTCGCRVAAAKLTAMTDLQDPDAATSEPTDGTVDDADIVVLPWWQNPVNIIVLFVGILILAGGAGFVIGERNATPHPNAVDVGFLQDMRTHHEQAVEMSLMFIAKTGTNQTIALIAQEIAFGQAVESGKMIQLLRDYGKPEAADDTKDVMVWMHEPLPPDRMIGLATQADLDRLANAKGADADALYLKLMITHHEGGIHMSQYAAAHAATTEVKKLATSMVSGEQEEIVEMQNLQKAS